MAMHRISIFLAPFLWFAAVSVTQAMESSSSAQKFIRISTDATDLILVPQGGDVHGVYFGPRVNNPDDLLVSRGKMASPVMPTFGHRTNNPYALEVTHANGDITTSLQFVGVKQTHDDVSETTIVQLKDSLHPFRVALHFQAFLHENIIKAWTVIEHEEESPVVLLNTPSAYLSFSADTYWLSSFKSSWGMETTLVEEPLSAGAKILENTAGTRGSFEHSPGFFLTLGGRPSEEQGRVIGGTLAWPGNWRLVFDLDQSNGLDVSAGMHPVASAYTLLAGQRFETPALLLSYSDSGKGEISRRFHRWARLHGGVRDGDKERPILLNSWEGAYFKFEEQTLLDMMDGVAKVGGECFVLDDGWFGNKHPRNNSTAGLGDWQCNTTKLPRGLSFLAAECAKRGLIFGLWFEPEMVNPASDLYEKHPDWVVHEPGRERIEARTQLVLDLSNPEVEEFAFQAIHQILVANPGIGYVKWDANRDVMNAGSAYLTRDRQSHLWIDYARALDRVAARVQREHPNVILQLCASGGGRVGYGLLPHFHEFWTSDNTDAKARLQMQWGTSHFFPAIAMASHVSASPNHQTKREIPLKFRFDVAMTGRLGMELHPKNLKPDEIDFAAKSIATYKKIRSLVQFGDLYRILSPYNPDLSFASLMYVALDKKQAVFFAYRTSFRVGEFTPRFTLRGLDPTKRYEITELNAEVDPKLARLGKGPHILGGDVLMNDGISLTLRREFDSAILLVTEKP